MSVAYQSVLEEIEQDIRPLLGQGKVADYIPALAVVSPQQFGMAIHTNDGELFTVGDARALFTIQSVSKVFTLAMALDLIGMDLWERIGREPSGDPFNSMILLESENGVPRNPFINPGAIVVADVLSARLTTPVQALLTRVQGLSGNPSVRIDPIVARSEKEVGHLNAAIAYFLKSRGNLTSDPQHVLDVYFRQCSIEMCCVDLARAFGHYANGGVSPLTGEQIMTAQRAKRINALMMTCGLYDGVGDFAFRVGLPAKSGVGGGIVGIIPGMLTVAVWSPGLDERGNSLAGVQALESLTTILGVSVL